MSLWKRLFGGGKPDGDQPAHDPAAVASAGTSAQSPPGDIPPGTAENADSARSQPDKATPPNTDSAPPDSDRIPNPKRYHPAIRVFVSSTFSDLVHERNALQDRVWPELERFCLLRGFQFQAIDLRWGVPTEAGLDHRTMRICFDELHRAQEVSPRPNFLILLGDRYGWQPLPEEITPDEFNALKAVAGSNPDHLRILNDWYRLDTNARPAMRLLRSRRESPDGQDYTQDAKGRDTAAWTGVQTTLWSLINRVYPPEKLAGRFAEPVSPDHPVPPIVRFQGSATEQEIWHGALAVPDARRHVIAFSREIHNLQTASCIPRLRDFVNVDEHRHLDGNLHGAIRALKDKLKNELGDNYLEAPQPATLRPTGDTVDAPALEISTDHLDFLCKQIRDRLLPIIEQQIEEYNRTPEPGSGVALSGETLRDLRREREQHARFALERAPVGVFVGREAEQNRILAYLTGDSDRPFILHGVSGSGKSALMAAAARQAAAAAPGVIMIQRHLGTTKRSSDLRSLLTDICQSLREHFPLADDLPTDIRLLEKEFYEQLRNATAERPVHVFLDALDQLDPGDDAHRLWWIRSTPLPEHARLVVSCLSDPEDETASGPWNALNQRGLPRPDNSVGIEHLEPDEAKLLWTRWLDRAQRNLNDKQQAAVDARVLQGPAACRQPIFLKLLFEEVRLWHSYDPATESGESVPALLGRLFDRLSLPTNHGPLLVNRVLGYLAASRHGLAENEILEILFADPEYRAKLNEATEQTRHELPPNAKRIPIALWSRLRFDLAPYLTERAAPGASVLTFYHRQFRRAAEQRYLSAAWQKLAAHRRLASYFLSRARSGIDKTWKVDEPRALREVSWHLFQGEEDDQLFSLAGDERFAEALRRAHPTEPGVAIETLEHAFRAAARRDYAAGMVTFLAREAMALRSAEQVSPIDALREGTASNLERACRQADMTEPQSRVLWHLLIAMDLAKMSKEAAARATLQRLAQVSLPVLNQDNTAKMAAVMMSELVGLWQETDKEEHLCALFDDKRREHLCERLGRARHSRVAIRVALGIHAENSRAAALAGLARHAARESKGTSDIFHPADDALQESLDKEDQDEYETATTIARVAEAKADLGDLDGAEHTLNLLNKVRPAGAYNKYGRYASTAILITRGDFSRAIREARGIPYAARQCGMLARIWEDRFRAEDWEAAQAAHDCILEEARKLVRIAWDLSSEVLCILAEVQVRAGDRGGANRTLKLMVEEIERAEDEWHVHALVRVGKLQRMLGDAESSEVSFVRARNEMTREVKETPSYSCPDYRSYQFLAQIQAEAGDLDGALVTLEYIDTEARLLRVHTLLEIAQWDLVDESIRRRALAIALKEADELDPAYLQRVLPDIVVSQAAAGDLGSARRSIIRALLQHETKKPLFRSGYTIRGLSRAYIESGNAPAALAWGNRERSLDTSLCHDIARLQAKQGAFAEALDTASKANGCGLTAKIQALSGASSEAIKTVVSINGSARWQDLKSISEPLVVAGDADAVLSAANRTDDPMTRGSLLTIAAEILQKRGCVERVKELLPLAKASASEMPAYDEIYAKAIFKNVAWLYLGIGDREAVYETISCIMQANAQVLTICELAERDVPDRMQGHISAAVQWAFSIEDYRQASFALFWVAEGCAKAGRLEQARDLVEAIASRIRHDSHEDFVDPLIDIARSQLAAGDTEGARRTLDQAEAWAGNWMSKLIKVAKALFEGGCPEEARRVLAKASAFARRKPEIKVAVESLAKCAVSQADYGDIEGALDSVRTALRLSRQIGDATVREWVLEDVIRAQVRLGLTDDAMALAVTIPSGAATAARAFLKSGSMASFKEAVLLCGRTPATVDEGCALIVQAYPKQVDAIAESFSAVLAEMGE